ncbi:DNA-binding transcriptional MerR regulator [Streptacidiphilus sp. MAP12-33]|uniref:hypothetical protein n=1 Tax=Streptacidiphilus sp. MAP12-33 TaxID=3156266 RepID=UPI0035141AF3
MEAEIMNKGRPIRETSPPTLPDHDLALCATALYTALRAYPVVVKDIVTALPSHRSTRDPVLALAQVKYARSSEMSPARRLFYNRRAAHPGEAPGWRAAAWQRHLDESTNAAEPPMDSDEQPQPPGCDAWLEVFRTFVDSFETLNASTTESNQRESAVGHRRDRDSSADLLALVRDLDAAVAALASADTHKALEHIAAAKESLLEDTEPVRVSVAARILGLSRRTVDAWVEAGILTPAESAGTTVKVVDPRSLYEVKKLVDDLRRAGKKRGLADAVWQRLQDQQTLSDRRLQESLDQMRRGEGVSLAEARRQLLNQAEDAGDDEG